MGTQSRTNPVCSSPWRVSVWLVLGLMLILGLSPAAGWSQTAAAAVALQLPAAVAFDAQGNLYIAERGAHVVRKLVPGGNPSIVAGTGVQGFAGDGGAATSARLDSPSGLAVDAAGNVYIADTHNHRIRKLTAATGVLSTVAGTGVRGFAGDGGQAASAQLDSPGGLAVAPGGDLYIADTGNHRIRRVSSAGGSIATIAGSGAQGFGGDGAPALAAAIDSPAGVALDAAGNVYLADTHNHRIRRVDAATGVITTVSGVSAPAPGFAVALSDGGPAARAALGLPRGLTVGPDGSVYVADAGDHRIRRIAADGTITTIAGTGAQTFAGDNSLATAAALDSPRAVAVSPGGLLTLADTANQRVRQVDAAPVPGPVIHTIAGVGVALSSGTLALSGPAAVPYGSGALTAALAPGAAAAGQVVFLDVSTASPATLGTVALTGGFAVFATSSLAAGTHAIVASYLGDATHSPAQSQSLTLSVTPLPIAAAVSPVSILYGQPVPALAGTLAGVLPQDAGKVSGVFGTAAAALSPAGTYPVTVSLSGVASANYVPGSVTGDVTIAPAPTATILAASASSAAAGDPVSIRIQAVSSTSGVPAGSVSLLDGSSLLARLPLVSGVAAYTLTALQAGAHSLSAVYVGDPNFLASSSQPALVTVGAGPDFSLAATGGSAQAIPSGSSASYTFSVTPQGGGLSSPISLAVDGLPLGATASMNPAYIPPGGQITACTLTVQTTKTAVAQGFPGGGGVVALAGFGVPTVFLLRRRPRGRRRSRRRFPLLSTIFASTTCILFATLISGCGNRVNAGAYSRTAPTYTLTITGTATSASGTVLKHATTVTLQVL